MYGAWRKEQIRQHLEALPPEEKTLAARQLLADARGFAQKLGEQTLRQLEKAQMERARLEEMRRCEKQLAQGARLICGIDEAGRGPLAGPVVAAAVILPEAFLPQGLNDSKKVTEARREKLYEEITAAALAWGVGLADPARIDGINILEATREAMLAAVTALAVKPDFILIDAVEIKALALPHRGIIRGDEQCLSIAAASILAKVTRDRLMTELGREWPQYGFEIHKGYGTAQHYKALQEYGPTVHHRRSFLKNRA